MSFILREAEKIICAVLFLDGICLVCYNFRARLRT